MATPVIMPRQGQSVESCIIAAWNKKKGDKVFVGDVLFSYETDKASFEEESKVEGILLDIFFEEGDDVPCLTTVCAIGTEGEDVSALRPSAGEEAPVAASQEAQKAAEIAPAVAASTAAASPNENVFISPRARGLASRQNVDYRYAQPTGPNGRIIERDVNALLESGVKFTAAAKDEYFSGTTKTEGSGIGGRISVSDLGAPIVPSAMTAPAADAEFEEVKLPNIRKVIAKAMHASLSTMAQLTLNASFDATGILAYREQIKSTREGLGLANITLNDIVLYAVSRTVTQHKDCNAHYYDDKMVYFKNVHLGVAVDTPKGLLVPTVFHANQKSLNELAIEVKSLAEQAQQGTIPPDYLKGGTITVTNLGSLGIETFTPVINPPQTCILGVNTIETKVKEVGGSYAYYPAMSLSLTFDHRALDGAPAAKFLKSLKTNLENFAVMLAK